ncbi:ABC transporter [Vairimorpha necatrix]|uniref:ABC transporter n=1 Tax=Vairimorpha necatrix TaxID=6039 RepID=A0AAX4JFC7_9MICR
MNKDTKILFNFLNDYKLYKIFIFIVLTLIFIFAYIEVTVCFDEIELLKNIGNKSKLDKCITLMIIIFLKKLGVYVVMHLLPIISLYFLTKAYRICICFYILKALNLNQLTYFKIGPNSIRSILDRKVFQTVNGLHRFLFEFSYSITSIISIIIVMYIYFNIYLTLFSIGIMFLVLILVVPIAKVRTIIRNRYTSQYDLVINNLYRITYNYDIIKSSKNEDLELVTLASQCRNIKYYGIRSAILSAFTGFLSKSMVTLHHSLVFYLILNKNKYFNVHTVAGFILFNKLFCGLRFQFNRFRNEYNTLLQYYTDIINNDWDEIRYDIENLKLYYEYKNFDNKDKEIKIKVENDKLKDQKMFQVDKNKEISDYMDFEIIKSTIIETQKGDLIRDGTKKFIFNDNISFQDFVLTIEDKILTTPANFRIKKGEKVGIVGKNGVGKSTLVNVFLRFKDYKGSIYIDNVEMRNIYKIDQRDKVSFIPQEPGILYGTIADNLLYNSQNMSVPDIPKLCTMYNMNFKDYKMDVGDNGKFLSGGEKQRISFLRGVIKNGDIFILDEPTANMDPKSEKNLIDMMHNFLLDKTIFAIIHKHHLLKKFDKIVGIYDKEIIVYNSYEKFLENSHLY